MVYYFKSTAVEPPALIYVGKDKTESQSWNALPAALLEDCAQLTKANSIEGNKRDNVTIIYTPWSNLKKDGSMAVGQVGFHDPKQTRRVLVATRTNAIINRLTKTRTEIPPPASSAHLAAEREAHHALLRRQANEVLGKQRKAADREARERRDDKVRREAEWNALYGQDRVEDEGRGNWEAADDDDFM